MIPRKKELPNLKKHRIILLAAAILILAVSCIFLLSPDPDEKNTQHVYFAGESVRILLETSIRNIERITIHPGKGNPYTLIERDGSLQLENDPDEPIRPEIINLIISNLEVVRAEEVIAENIASPAALIPYGLNPGQCSVSIVMKDGTEHTIALGNQIVGDIPYYYFIFDSSNCVYAGSTDMYQAFSYTYDMLHPVEQPHLDASLISRVELSGIRDFAMEYTDVGWQMTVPYSYPLSSSFSTGFLTNLESIRFTRYICSVQNCDLSDYGLDHPIWTLQVETGDSLLTGQDDQGNTHQIHLPGSTDLFLIGNAYDDTSRYCLYDNNVYTLGFLFEQALTRFQTVDALLLNPVNYEFYSLYRLELNADGRRCHYQISLSDLKTQDGSLQTDEDGNPLYEMHVVRDGTVIDSDIFAAWYNELRRYAPEGLADGMTAAGCETAAEILLFSDLHTRKILLKKADNDKLLLEVDGSIVFYGNSSVLELLNKAP